MSAVFFTFALSGAGLAGERLGVGEGTRRDVRLLLLPVFLRLAGRAAWCMPRGLGRLLPRIQFSHES